MIQQVAAEPNQNISIIDTVLIVDDDPVNIRLLLEILGQDYRVLIATGGLQALKLIDKHSDIDLILLDVDMPGMTGFDVLHQMRKNPEKKLIPVILVTGRNQSGDEAYGLEQGAVDYISKPISGAVVKARVKTQINLTRTQRSLAHNNRELEQALAANKVAKKELTQFTAMVSHELRTPVAILLCEIELLIDGIRKPDKKNLLSLQEEVKHFSSLIDDMFDLVLSEARTLKYNKEVCRLDVLITRSVELFKRQFEDSGLDLSFSTENIFNASIFADPHRIRQVIDNVVKNTLKYTDSGGKLVISSERKGDWVWVYFQDSSPGVTSEELGHLFDRLYRVEQSRNRATGGAGLGLAICKTIIMDHQGKILAEHSPYGGVRISIGMQEHY